jgi:hypothetical protein
MWTLYRTTVVNLPKCDPEALVQKVYLIPQTLRGLFFVMANNELYVIHMAIGTAWLLDLEQYAHHVGQR